ncbi:hypothetical protein Vretimale_16986, partial [Volvox reticuliferus]
MDIDFQFLATALRNSCILYQQIKQTVKISCFLLCAYIAKLTEGTVLRFVLDEDNAANGEYTVTLPKQAPKPAFIYNLVFKGPSRTKVSLYQLLSFRFKKDSFRKYVRAGALEWAKEQVKNLSPDVVPSFILDNIARNSWISASAAGMLGGLSGGEFHWPLIAWTELQ